MDKEGKMMIFLLLMAGNIITHFDIIPTCTPLKGALCSCWRINLDQREKSAFIDFFFLIDEQTKDNKLSFSYFV